MNQNKILEKPRAKADLTTSLGLVAVVVFFIVSGIVSYMNTRSLYNDVADVTHTHDVITSIDMLMSLVKDAETGQRGYIITGDRRYLEPYIKAVGEIDERLNRLDSLTKDNRERQQALVILKKHVYGKLHELEKTIDMRRDEGLEGARQYILNDRGKQEMDAIRASVAKMRDEERTLRSKRFEEMEKAYNNAIVSGIISGLLGAILSLAVGFLVRKAGELRFRQEWLQVGQVGLANAMLGDQRMEQLGENILGFLTKYLDAHAAAFFTREGDFFRRIATYGVPDDQSVPKKVNLNEGLIGQAARENRKFTMRDVPEGYLSVASGLGKGKPKHLVIFPVSADGVANAVIELGFVHPMDENTIALIDEIADAIGMAVRSANYRANLQNLLEETQRQAEELQAQSEELRVSNEELEEQSRALKESQARLEQQQAELEQTNSQLEEQTQLLEIQRDDITRAKAEVEKQADELERTSQYKSDFLANMSHELRTPLNSSLILAKLLADNPEGNLTEEQVKFAQTIQNSGNDLLALINDILDLSKIEAGHMEINAEPVYVDRIINDLARTFEPMAKHKGLSYNSKIEKGCPQTIVTDRQRLEQVLKNLLSNALKFTEKGGITFKVSKPEKGRVAFTVTDTGIGIEPEQQQAIFEAFRQADGTISRKYGGTGLGLSISRELSRLLGGAIELHSESGKGSSFTIIIPEQYSESEVPQRPVVVHSGVEVKEQPKVKKEKPKKEAVKISRIEDDRENLGSSDRVILVVEDDKSFVQILYKLAHELNFRCLISHTAEEAIILAKQYLPSAVLLDVGLPDNSGLSVLDRLKRDPHTRHIPVHVVSASDYAQKALSLGAVGYMLKPVKREELVDTLKVLENKLSQSVRKVLIVEDDPVQLDSVKRLLGTHDVKTFGVGTAAECLEQLKKETFDCMVLDLSLPDASGYSLLETLSKEDGYSFPPVIVYTGRDLSADEEQKLRRYSKSIIIKGAKSPERLLDEVMLFLHQVVSELPAEQQKMLEKAKNRDAMLEGRRILIVEDDVANVYALTSILEPRGAVIQIARNGREAVEALKAAGTGGQDIDLVLMDVMMPEVDGLTATRQIRKNPEWKKLPIIMLTAKAMRDDQERCLEAGANDYMAKPLDVEKLLSLVRVWMPR